MLNFTVGPVMANEEICALGAEQVPYFRTAEFSQLMLENEKYILEFAKAKCGSRVVFLTSSSTGAMEAAVMNCLSSNSKALVINGGSFGQRFSDLCSIHGISFDEIILEPGQELTKEKLYEYDGKGYTDLLVNIDETSTAVLYDSLMIGDFCRKNNMFYICDCVSSFLADSFDMDECGANVMITGSQKALACPPGISIVVLDPKALDRIEKNEVRSLYFNLRDALKNQERGQTPFTPAVGILIQINARLKQIKELGGVDKEVKRVAALAQDFREKIKDFPFKIFSQNPANGVTSLEAMNVSANDIFLTLKDEYNIWICPNGGKLKDKIFRVGHIGALSFEDNDKLIEALKDMQSRGLI